MPALPGFDTLNHRSYHTHENIMISELKNAEP